MTHARTYARTHTHGANYNLPPASRAGDNKMSNTCHNEETYGKIKVKQTNLTKNEGFIQVFHGFNIFHKNPVLWFGLG